jgi:hypothetical protein
MLRTVFSDRPRPVSADTVIETATLVLSELVTNAVNAGCERAACMLSVHRNYVQLAVTDDTAGQLELLNPAPRDDHGRGLRIVDAVCRSWGVHRTRNGKRVWAELSVPNRLLVDLPCDLVRA